MNGDSLGDRMKSYEDIPRIHLTRRLPMIIRLDGKAFHTWTRGLKRPYCEPLMEAMDQVAIHLCGQVQNTVLAYTQSDEISLALVDYKNINTSAWFDGNVQKMASVAAGLASSKLTALSPTIFGEVKEAVFDARVFVLPPHEVTNYFIWRQQDWNRNSLAMLAQSLYSHKELQNKGRVEQHEMCFQKGVNWSDLHSHLKDGRVVVKRAVEKDYATEFVPGEPPGTRELGTVVRREWYVPETTPVFSADREFIEGLVRP